MKTLIGNKKYVVSIFVTILIVFGAALPLEVISAPSNSAPVFTDGTSTTHTIAENTASGINIGTPVSATDVNNDTLTYSLSGTDAAVFSIDNNTGQLRTKSALDYETKQTYTVIVTVSDGSLTDTITITINITDIPEVSLTARFEALPESHDGSTFTFELHFSEKIRISYRNVRDDVLNVTGGTVKAVRRLQQGSNLGWEITIEPESNAEVSIVLLPTEDCDAVGAVCTTDRRPLSSELRVIVPGPSIPEAPKRYRLSAITPQVRDAIVAALPGVNSANDVTEAHLATITSLNLRNKGISTLNAGDFDGLTALTELQLQGNQLRTLPADVFSELSSLKTLDLGNNQLTSLSPEVFSGLTAVTDLHIHNNQLATLPQNLFSGMSSLTQINIHSNRLRSIHEDAFSGLPSLTQLFLRNNRLTSLPQDVFSGLSKLQYLYLDGNQLTDLPTAVFSGLSSLIQLLLNGNQLSTLPAGVFRGLTRLTLLQLQANSVALMPLTVSLEKVGVNQFKATAPAGAPFAIILPVSVANGSISGGATTLTIPQGGVESTSRTVTRTSGTTGAVTVDIGNPLPGLPTRHRGYEPVKSANLPLTIFNAPSNRAPVFTDGAAVTRSVAENTASGINIGSAIGATDADNDSLTYSLSGTDASAFSIVSTTGQLQTSAALDYEAKNSYTVTVTAFDGSSTDTITVTINVTDANDAPTLTDGTSTSRSVAENTAAGNDIGTPVAATDPDNDTLEYSLGGTDAASFGINSTNGQLRTSASLNYESRSSYSVTISVSDGNGGSDSISVTINVTNVNEAPAFKHSSDTRSIPENTAANTSIGNALDVSEPDGDSLTYSLGGADAASFTFDSTTRRLLTKAALDYETKTSYTVVVTVSDGTLTDTITITINVTNVNEAPVFSDSSSTSRSIAENTASGNNIGSAVAATDPDSGTTLTYTLGGTDAASFGIVSSSGQLQTKAALEYETKTSYSVTVSVSDGNGGTDSITVTINVTDVPDTPDPPLSERTQQVRDAIVAAVPGVSSADDVTATHLAAITSLGLGNKGITTLKTGDFDGLTSLTSLDLGDNSISDISPLQNLTNLTWLYLSYNSISDISVLENLTNLTWLHLSNNTSLSDISALEDLTNLTSLYLYNTSLSDISVLEDLTNLTTLYLSYNRLIDISALEDLTNLRYLYLRSNRLSDISALEDLTNLTRLWLRGNPISDYGPLLRLIAAIEAAGRSLDLDITIPTPPVFTDGAAVTRSVAENTASGINIGSAVGATDADNDSLTYSLSGTDASAFSIVSTTGQLQTSAALDYEAKNSYTVTVTAFDGSSTDTITVTINVTDANDAPTLTDGTSTSRSVAENTAAGNNIGTAVAATDADDDTLTWTLGGTDAASFGINSTNGQLRTSASLNYESRSSYSVTISVSDGNGGSDSISVTINVTDANDAPTLTDGTSTSRSVAENTAAGNNIGTAVAATDADDDTLTWTLGGTDAASFGIVSSSGQLQTKASLNYETKTSYSVTVSVSDGNGGTDSITVTINVTDVPDTPDPPLSERTRQVRDAIVAAVPGVSSADDVTATHLAAITLLRLDDKGITTLQTGDFDGLTSLTRLDLYNNSLSDISALEDLTNLTTLYLSGNSLSDISALEDLTNLTTLSLPDNNLSDISALEDLTNLTTLGLTDNSISDISTLQNLTNLTTLGLDDNSLSDISPLENLTNLRYLTLAKNSISDYGPLRRLIAAIEAAGGRLHLDITIPPPIDPPLSERTRQVRDAIVAAVSGVSSADDVTATHLAAITSLSLDNKGITTLQTGDFDGLTSLTRLSLGDNSISDISTLQNLTNLTLLDLSYNPLSDISPLQNLTNLTLLDLTDNSIGDISPLQNLTNLTTLYLSYNPLSDISPLQNLTNLRYLYLIDNSIIDISPLQNLTNLTWLLLSYNSIIDISPLQNLTNLTLLHLPDNSIIDISALQNLTNLTTLDLSDNSISDISALESLTNLGRLNLRGNTISDYGPLLRLIAAIEAADRSLDLDITIPIDPPLSERTRQVRDAIVAAVPGVSSADDVTAAHLAAIKELDIRESGISSLQAGDFNGLTALTDLDLRNNSLSDISALQNLTNLTYLTLRDNSLSDISALHNLTSLTDLNLGNNTSLSDISPLENLTNLTSLYLQDTSISDISPLQNLTNLTTLYLDDTSISDISVLEHLTNLRALNLGNNTSLSDISVLENLTNLRYLSLSDTSLSNISALESLTNLTRLNLSGNTISDYGPLRRLIAAIEAAGGRLNLDITIPIPIDPPLSERTRQVRDAIVAAVPRVSSADDVTGTHLAAITLLNLINKGITTLQTGDFDGLTSLTYLYLNNNRISDISPLEDLTNLRHLYLNNTSISDISPLQNLTNLTWLHLRSNSISDISALEDLTNLTRLYLRGNTISDYGPLRRLIAAIEVAGGSLRLDITIPPEGGNTAPTFTDGISTTRSIAENTAAGINIGSAVSATDPDNDTLEYSLGGTDASSFDINSTNGQLRTSAALNYESRSSYSVTISVSDGNGGSDSITVTINVTDANDAPTLTDGTSTSRSVAENTAAGNNIGTAVAATDADDDTLTWTLGGTDAASFGINSTNGQLRTSASLNYESRSSYSVTISVSDGNGGSDSISVTINVTNVNEAPAFKHSSDTRSIPENTAANTSIGNALDVSEPDGDSLTYSLGGADAASFTFDSTTRRLLTKAALDYETKTSYTVVITVSDGTLTDTITITINVTNVNEAPVFSDSSSTSRSIAENTASGNNIGSAVAATDPDSGTTLTYTLGGTDAASFGIVSSSGQLQTKASLNYETKTSYSVTVSVSDGNGGTDSITVTINVTDVPDTPDPPLSERTQQVRDAIVAAVPGVSSADDVTAAHLAAITELDIRGSGISSLQAGDFNGLTALTDLDLRNNSLIDISALENLTNLTYLTLRDNSLSDISALENLTSLTSLNLGNNTSISDISALEHLTNLTLLYLYNTSISDISTLQHLTNLTTLELSGTSISDISPLEDLTNLRWLTLAGNTISDYGPLRRLIAAIEAAGGRLNLDITIPTPIDPPLSERTRQVRDAIVAAVPGVSSADDVTATHLAAITLLNLINKGITTLQTGDFDGLTSLTYLYLNNNSISDISALEHLTNLRYLYLRSNSISDISALEHLTNLTSLRLAGNTISDYGPLRRLIAAIEAADGSLRLDITIPTPIDPPLSERTQQVRDAIVAAVPGVSSADDVTGTHLAAITSLSLNDKGITTLQTGDFDGLTSLTRLKLGDNSLSDISTLQNLTNLTNLTTLDLRSNRISDISTLQNLTNLTWLYLTNNSISDISPLQNLTNLTRLWLWGNPISDYEPLRRLIAAIEAAGGRLNLDITIPLLPLSERTRQVRDAIVAAVPGVSSADDVTARHLAAITLLSLDNKGITTLQTGDFDGLTSLTRLHLGDNSLSDISPLQNLTNLTRLWLRGNPISDYGPLRRLIAVIEAAGRSLYLDITIPEEADNRALSAPATPIQTELLPNFPNPFNPETWIPYQLSKPAEVTLTIYDMRGVVVRQLKLGQKPAGVYLSRSRAIHWDGKNTFGEKVAAGVYFYQLQADSVSFLRKMAILK